MSVRDRLTMFFYLLTRGSPVEIDGVRHQLDGLPWGAVNGLIKVLPAHDVEPKYSSKGGEALARELAANLLGDVKGSTSAVLEVADALEQLHAKLTHLQEQRGYISSATDAMLTAYKGQLVDLLVLAQQLRASVWG